MENTRRDFKDIFKFPLLKMLLVCWMIALNFFIREMKGTPCWVLTTAQICGFNISLLSKDFTDLFTKEEQKSVQFLLALVYGVIRH